MVASAKESQLNARIDNALKERGNRALLRAGYTPARAIRSLWAIAAENEDDPHMIEAILSGGCAGCIALAPEEDQDAANSRLDILHRSWDAVGRRAQAAGLHLDGGQSSITYDELRELAAAEQLAKYAASEGSR